MNPKLLLLFLSLAPALFAQSTHPVVTWQTPTAVSGPSDVLTTGTLVAAINTSNSDRTVNGITFTPTSGYLMFDRGTHTSPELGSVSTGNSAYDALLNRGYYTEPGDYGWISLPYLEPGHDYRIQIWTAASETDQPTRLQSAYDYTAPPLLLNNTATVPTYVVGTFTATYDNFLIEFQSTDWDGTGVIAAAAVFDVTGLSAIPEPSTYAALAGGLALGWVGWKRRRRPVETGPAA